MSSNIYHLVICYVSSCHLLYSHLSFPRHFIICSLQYYHLWSSCQLSDILSCTVCHLFISYCHLPRQSVVILSSTFSICSHLANLLPVILLNLSFCQSSILPVSLLSGILPVNLIIACQSCLLMIIKLSKNI